MTESLSQQVANLRMEIAARDTQLIAGVFLVIVLIIMTYVVAVVTEKPALYKLTVLLVLTGVFFVARQDYLENRPAGWIKLAAKAIESQQSAKANSPSIPNWEDWKDALWSRKLFMPVVDLLSAIAIFYIFWDCERALFKQEPTFVWWTVTGLPVAIGAVFLGILIADK